MDGSISGSLKMTDDNLNLASNTQTINLTGIVPIVATVTLSNLMQTFDGSFKAATVTTVPAGLAVTMSYDSNSTAPPTNAGSYTVTATVTNPNYSGTRTGTLVISQATPDITWGTPAPITYGTALSATQLTATSGAIAGAFAYTPSNGTVMGTGINQTLSVTFTPFDTINYTSATSTVSLTVNRATPAIIFAVPSHTYGDAEFAVSASSNSTGAFTYMVSGPGTISGSTVSLIGVGSVVLEASQAADLNYTAGTKNASFTVTAGTPSLIFTVPGHSYGDVPFAVSASSNSAGSFLYTVVSGPATISGSSVTITGAGTVVLQASQAADSNNTASKKNATFTVAAGTPSLAFIVPVHTFGDAPFTVSASSNSMGAFTYTVSSGPATISGSSVTLTGAGTVSLQASQAADSNYAAGTKTATFTVAANAPILAFTVPGHTYGDAPFAVSASSNSTSAFTYTVVLGPATISGSSVTLTGAGTVSLQASQAADSNYAAGTKTATFTVAVNTPILAFAVPGHSYGDVPFAVSASSNSTGAFTYTVVSGPATISGSSVTLTGAGAVVLQASQTADSNNTASTKTATFMVAAGTPSLVFTVPDHTYGDAPFAVSASSNSTSAFTYTVVSGPATISGSSVTLTGAGTVALSANLVASGNYTAGTATTTFVVTVSMTLTTGTGSGSGTGSDHGTATMTPGAAATIPLMFTPGGATYPNALTLSVVGLPPGTASTFSPESILAGSAATAITLTIDSIKGTARNVNPFSAQPFAPLALGFLLVPLAGMKSFRRRLSQMPRFPLMLAVMILALGATLGLSGCGGHDRGATNYYNLVITATDTITGAHSSTNLILVVK